MDSTRRTQSIHERVWETEKEKAKKRDDADERRASSVGFGSQAMP